MKALEASLASARAALAEETVRADALNRIAAAIGAGGDLDQVVQTVVDGGVELTGAAFGAFFYTAFDDNGDTLTLYSLSGAPRSAFDHFPMVRRTAVFAPTFDGEGILRSDDITTDPRYGRNAPFHGMPKGHLPVRSYMGVPVISRSGEVLGALLFGHPEPGRFSERLEHLMAGVGAQAAVASTMSACTRPRAPRSASACWPRSASGCCSTSSTIGSKTPWPRCNPWPARAWLTPRISTPITRRSKPG